MSDAKSQSVASVLTLQRRAGDGSIGVTLVRLAHLASMRHQFGANEHRLLAPLSETRGIAVSYQATVSPNRFGDGTDAVWPIERMRVMGLTHKEVSR